MEGLALHGIKFEIFLILMYVLQLMQYFTSTVPMLLKQTEEET